MTEKEMIQANNNIIVVDIAEEMKEKGMSKASQDIVWGLLKRFYLPKRARLDNNNLCFKCRTCDSVVSAQDKHCLTCGQLLIW